MLELQRLIFEQKLSRKQLLEYQPTAQKQFKICVYRNHSFELVEHTLTLYLDYAGIGAEFVYSDYDDSLTFFNLPQDTDMMIIWLDISRYTTDNVNDFLKERLAFLRSIYTKNILFVPFDWNQKTEVESVVICDLDSVLAGLGERKMDLRMEKFTGTRMSAPAISLASKELGLKYIPSLLLPSLKAVVVDLDNTLYKGVLGEDGINGVELTDGHAALQSKLHQLAEKGFFICVASKNEEQDVVEMFQQRNDFPLWLEDFSKLCVSWNSKANSIGEIAEFLNIGTDSILFVDDNLGEINSVASVHDGVHVLHAYDNAFQTLEVLEYYPRLSRYISQKEDALRRDDVIANEKRKELQASMSGEDYIKSLEMKLEFNLNNRQTISRVAELANKTNQFIFNYKRYQQAEVEKLISSETGLVITVSLADKLSDSGIIGVCCAVLKEDYVEIEECFVSCRALGRGIDESIVLGAIELACKHFNTRRVKVCFQKGERNTPAERFVSEQFGKAEDAWIESFEYMFPTHLVTINVKEN